MMRLPFAWEGVARRDRGEGQPSFEPTRSFAIAAGKSIALLASSECRLEFLDATASVCRGRAPRRSVELCVARRGDIMS